MLVPFPPPTGVIRIEFALPRLPSRENQNVTLEPSGEKTGCVSSRSFVVSRRSCPVATSTKATRAESGVRAGGASRGVPASALGGGARDGGGAAGRGGGARGRLHVPGAPPLALPPHRVRRGRRCHGHP